MLNLLQARALGVDNPIRLRVAETTRRVFSLELSKYQDVQQVHDSAINTLDIDKAEERYLLSGSACGGIAIHDLHACTGEPKCTFASLCTVGYGNPDCHKKAVETATWYPLDTGMFLSSGMDEVLKVWDTNRLRVADEFSFSGNIYCHDLSNIATTHNLISVGYLSNNVRLVDLKSGASVHTLRGHKKSVVSTKWSTREEFLLATGSLDNKVMLWDVRSAKGCLQTLDQHNGKPNSSTEQVNTAHNGAVSGLCFTPDGLHLVTLGTDQRMRVWNTTSGKNTLVNFGKIPNQSKKGVKLTISQGTDPPIIFVPSESNIEVFLMDSGEKVASLKGHYNRVHCSVYNPHTQDVFSGGSDKCVLVWTPDVETVQAYSRHLVETTQHKEKRGNFMRRIGATVDAWSSDED